MSMCCKTKEIPIKCLDVRMRPYIPDVKSSFEEICVNSYCPSSSVCSILFHIERDEKRFALLSASDDNLFSPNFPLTNALQDPTQFGLSNTWMRTSKNKEKSSSFYGKTKSVKLLTI